MKSVVLERMDVDDVGFSPERIAAEIHRQLGDIEPPVPVYEIARALDIDDIQESPLSGFEGMLLTEAERDFGKICVNSRSHFYRRRYSVGHELGHFLCRWHRQTQYGAFTCRQQDMAFPTGDDRHVRQEAEANLFAIELLAPKRMVAPYLKRLPELEQVLSIHTKLQISRTAAARRYIHLHRENLAVIFAKDGLFQYIDRGGGFPYVRLERGQVLPELPRPGRDTPTSEMQEVDPEEWPGLELTSELSVQVLSQEHGHAIVLLHLAGGEDEGD